MFLLFYDDLSDIQSSTETTAFSYVAIGWYSDPTADPVYGSQYGTSGWTTAQQWLDLMANLNWAIPTGSDNLPATSLPKQSLCQGLIYGVQWQTQTLPDRVNSDPTLLQVAVGNSGIDAFAALIEAVGASQTPPVNIPSDLIEAFQYNLLPLLDQSDGDAQLDLKVRRAWFGSSPGGLSLADCLQSAIGFDRHQPTPNPADSCPRSQTGNPQPSASSARSATSPVGIASVPALRYLVETAVCQYQCLQ
jgi:hypothetical protein